MTFQEINGIGAIVLSKISQIQKGKHPIFCHMQINFQFVYIGLYTYVCVDCVRL